MAEFEKKRQVEVELLKIDQEVLTQKTELAYNQMAGNILTKSA